MAGIVLTFPILPGKVEAWRRFCQEMAGSRSQTYEASRRRLGITRERMALVENGFGAVAVTTFEAQNLGQALGQIITSSLPFDDWYRQQLEELHGVNLARYEQFVQPAPPALPQELLFEWRVPEGAIVDRDVRGQRAQDQSTGSTAMQGRQPAGPSPAGDPL